MRPVDLLLIMIPVAVALGCRVGFARRMPMWVGATLGLTLAGRFAPEVAASTATAGSGTRAWAIVLFHLAGAALGGAAGDALGSLVGGHADVPERGDRIAGTAMGLVAAVLLAWLAVPGLAQVPGGVGFTPEAASAGADGGVRRSSLDSVRGALLGMTLRSIAPHPPELEPPASTPLSPDVRDRVAASTVKVSGVACSRRQDGSGFAAGPDLVATNAHVVAGVAYPEVRRPDGRRLPARVVVFDPARDLALLHVPGLGQAPLPVGNVDVGEAAAVFGHPGGQDALEISPATVTSQASVVGNDLYERDQARRQLLFLAARLAPGDSGGALVDPTGAVVGVAFAVAPGQHTTAYALSSAELRSVLAAPRHERASTGACVG